MKDFYIKELDTANSSGGSFEKLTHVTSILRSLLQLITVSALELAERQTPTDAIDLDEYIERFKNPSDGLPIWILDGLVPHLRIHIHPRVGPGFFEMGANSDKNLSQDLQEWVAFRNNYPAHGVTDTVKAALWANKTASLITRTLHVFDELIPELSESGALRLHSKQIDCLLDTPMSVDGNAVVIRKITQKKAGSKIVVQTLSILESKEITLNIPSSCIFSSESSRQSFYDIVCVNDDHSEHILEHNIPKRQTDTFEGREKEIAIIEEWLNDGDSRRCQICGDGGFGKTTLLLEVLNRYIEGNITVDKLKPTLICYYTAKMTRWNASGLTHLSAIQPMMIECLHELFRGLHLSLEKSVYTANCRQLIGRIETAMQTARLNRDDILLIIDNTETLATDKDQTGEFRDLLMEIGKKLCRLIITSRRQEMIEAKPILVGGLSLDESISLLRRLAKDYGASAILQAGDSRLRRISEKLMQKPLLLEALVVYINRAGIGIDAAMTNLFQMSEESLLEFLYDDAWARLSEAQKQMFFVSVSITTQLNSISIGRACQLIEIQHSEFQRSLAETHFSVMTDYGDYYDIELVDLAKRFFEKKLNNSSQDIKLRIKDFASQVDVYVAEREATEKEYVEDRVADAFRNEYAKAAKVAVDKLNFLEADEFYQIAIQADPANSALHDRYALFLLNKIRDSNRALDMSLKAVELNPDSCDANVTLAMVYYRISNLDKGDIQIDISSKLGRAKDFCFLQKGIARYHQACKISESKAKLEYLDVAGSFLTMARKASNPITGYGAKNLNDIVKHQNKVLRLLNSLSK
jgi:tetratricopeptide (TPR) repeat protein